MNKSEQDNGRMPAEVQRENILRKLAELNQQLEELEAEKEPQSPRMRNKYDVISIRIRALKQKIRQAEALFDRREETDW